MTPSLVWVALDRHVWTSDPAWYGSETLRLYYALIDSPARWPAALIKCQAVKPPAISWMGQAFVPVGQALGSIDFGLLMFVVLTQLAAMMLLFRAICHICDGKPFVAFCGAVMLAASPLFIAMCHGYWTESLVTMCVAWFVLIMSCARTWRRSFLLSQLVAATALALAVKATSVLYCLGPALVALGCLWERRKAHDTEPWARHKGTVITLAIGLPLLLAVLVWYAKNWRGVLRHAVVSASSPLYGSSQPIVDKLVYWLGVTRQDLFYLPVLAWGVCGVLIAGGALWIRRSRRWTYGDLCVGVSMLATAVVLMVLAANVTETVRLVLPMFVFISVAVAWGLTQISRMWVTSVVLAGCIAQFGMVQAQSFGWRSMDVHLNLSRLRPIHRGNRNADELRAIVAATCHPEGNASTLSVTVVGVQLLRLNQDTLNYVRLKDPMTRRQNCEFWGIYRESFDKTVELIHHFPVQWVVTIDPAVQTFPTGVANAITGPLWEKLQTDRSFREVRLSEYPRIVLFQRTRSE